MPERWVGGWVSERVSDCDFCDEQPIVGGSGSDRRIRKAGRVGVVLFTDELLRFVLVLIAMHEPWESYARFEGSQCRCCLRVDSQDQA